MIIAGPGAGKTYGMVNTILDKLKLLSPCRYIIVITYTNSAAENIRSRLAGQILLPPNLFIGTIHSFLNRFIVIPFSSLHNEDVGKEKLFIQCDTDDVFETYRKNNKKKYSHQETAILKARLKDSLNTKGYISFDQTIALAKNCVENERILNIISNRIQYLFVDEFQDTNNAVFYIIESLRKKKKTHIYCVGDPEQFIQSFNSNVKKLGNIPILKILTGKTYNIEFNTSNYRCAERIVQFLNNFNTRHISGAPFQQQSKSNLIGHPIKYISAYGAAKSITDVFNHLCSNLNIVPNDRCVLAKRNEIVDRIKAGLNNNCISPNKAIDVLPIKSIMDTLLSAVDMNQAQFCKTHNTDVFTIRKYSISILKAIKNGVIKEENTFAKFLVEKLNLTIKPGVPIKISNVKVHIDVVNHNEAVIVSNIHTIKGLESEAVLVIAKTEQELLQWIETDIQVRDGDKTDYSRLGYVAFSRAKQLLCIACLEPISATSKGKLSTFNIEFVDPTSLN